MILHIPQYERFTYLNHTTAESKSHQISKSIIKINALHILDQVALLSLGWLQCVYPFVFLPPFSVK